MELSRHTKWVHDSGKATKEAIAQYQTIAASDPGPALLIKKRQDCDSLYPKAAHSHGAIGQVKPWRSCYDDAQTAADAATAAYMAAVSPSAPSGLKDPVTSAMQTAPPVASAASVAPASDNSMLYAGIGFLAIVAAILYFTQSKTPAAA